MRLQSREGSSKTAHDIIRSATVTLRYRMDKFVGEALHEALLPETRSGSKDGVCVCLQRRGDVLTIKTESPDLFNLRAAVNSYGYLVKAGSDCANISLLLRDRDTISQGRIWKRPALTDFKA